MLRKVNILVSSRFLFSSSYGITTTQRVQYIINRRSVGDSRKLSPEAQQLFSNPNWWMTTDWEKKLPNTKENIYSLQHYLGAVPPHSWKKIYPKLKEYYYPVMPHLQAMFRYSLIKPDKVAIDDNLPIAFELMKDAIYSGETPFTSTYEIFIICCVNNFHLEKAEELLFDMLERDIPPNGSIFAEIVCGYIIKDQYNHAEKIYNLMLSFGDNYLDSFSSTVNSKSPLPCYFHPNSPVKSIMKADRTFTRKPKI